MKPSAVARLQKPSFAGMSIDLRPLLDGPGDHAVVLSRDIPIVRGPLHDLLSAFELTMADLEPSYMH